MEEIEKEFSIFLHQLVESYPKATSTILKNPSSLADVSAKSRDFSSKAKNKIYELAAKNGKNPTSLNIDLASIQVEYHSLLMSGHI